MSNTMTIIAGTVPFFGRIGDDYAGAVAVAKTFITAAAVELAAAANRRYVVEIIFTETDDAVEVLFFDHDADAADAKIAGKVEALVIDELSGAAELGTPEKTRGRPRKNA